MGHVLTSEMIIPSYPLYAASCSQWGKVNSVTSWLVLNVFWKFGCDLLPILWGLFIRAFGPRTIWSASL